MGFTKALVEDLKEKLFLFKTEMIGEEVVITIPDHKIKLVKASFSTILWLLVPEIQSKAERVKFVLINESNTSKFSFDFNPLAAKL